jgi:hypothetical protein
MKRNPVVTLISIGIICISLCNVNVSNAGAFSATDNRFPEHRFIIPIIAPYQNTIYLRSNDDNSSAVKSVFIFASSQNHDLVELKTGDLTLPLGATQLLERSYIEEDAILVPGAMSGDYVPGLADNIVSTLYYVVKFWDGTSEAYRISYQDCIDAGEGDMNGIECKIGEYDGNIVYDAYRFGTRIFIEKEPVPDVIIEPELPTHNTDDVITEQDSLSTEESIVGTTQSVPESNSQNTTYTTSSHKNVKNTKTDVIASTLPAISDTGHNLPPTAPGSTNSSINPSNPKTSNWWSLIPLILLLIILAGSLVKSYIQKTRTAKQEQANY